MPTYRCRHDGIDEIEITAASPDEAAREYHRQIAAAEIIVAEITSDMAWVRDHDDRDISDEDIVDRFRAVVGREPDDKDREDGLFATICYSLDEPSETRYVLDGDPHDDSAIGLD